MLDSPGETKPPSGVALAPSPAASVEPRDPDVLRGSGDGDNGQESSEIVAFSGRREWSGPLPPADEFNRFGLTQKDAPARILAMAEADLAHQHQLALLQQRQLHEFQMAALAADGADADAGRSEARIGQVIGGGLVLTALVLGAICGGWYGAIIGAIGFGGVITAFVVSRSKQGQQSTENALMAPEQPNQP